MKRRVFASDLGINTYAKLIRVHISIFFEFFEKLISLKTQNFLEMFQECVIFLFAKEFTRKQILRNFQYICSKNFHFLSFLPKNIRAFWDDKIFFIWFWRIFLEVFVKSFLLHCLKQIYEFRIFVGRFLN